MKLMSLFAGLAVLLLLSCMDTATDTAQTQKSNEHTVAGLHLKLEANPEWQYENLRLYPICADEKALALNAGLPALKTLAEGMNTPGFRITERKQFGRERDAWYNALTVQNKSDAAIFLMSGDVVTGGNQDRVIAYDDVIQPGSLKNIDVFCVEAGRSTYYNPAAPESEKQVAAFRGYYNVASPQVRRAVYSGNQQGVWNAVEKITIANNAASTTKTYAALETANDQKAKREAYLNFFREKFTGLEDVVGVVAVCDGNVIGVDIFGQTDLFQQQYKALLHGYAAEAAVAQNSNSLNDMLVTKAFAQVASLASPARPGNEAAGKFAIGDAWVHLFLK